MFCVYYWPILTVRGDGGFVSKMSTPCPQGGGRGCSHLSSGQMNYCRENYSTPISLTNHIHCLITGVLFPFCFLRCDSRDYNKSHVKVISFYKVCKLPASDLSHDYFYIFVIYTVDVYKGGQGVRKTVKKCPRGLWSAPNWNDVQNCRIPSALLGIKFMVPYAEDWRWMKAVVVFVLIYPWMGGGLCEL